MTNNALQRNLKYVIKFFLVNLICMCEVLASPNVEGIQVYQNNLRFIPSHKQKLADDITRYRNADNIWDVLRNEFALPHYDESPAVQEKIEWFMNNQDFLLRSATRAAPYLYYILQQVRKRHLPVELVLLPIIESGYNPFSLSNVGAAGIWQLMPDTATGLGVKRDWWYDGRRDLIASTHAALNYLAYLQSFFEGNWLYAIAAYNTGEGNVLSAIKKNIRSGKDTEFWSLPLAQQTRDYVPSLLALAVIISNPDKYPIYFPAVRNAPYLAQINVGTQINLKYAASLAGLSYKKLIELNPGFNGPSTSKKGPYKLVLPIENVEQFSDGLVRSSLSPPIDWIHYKVKSSDTLITIAKKFDTTPNAILKLNHLSKNAVHHGVNLLIPTLDKNENNDENTQDVIAVNEDTKNDESTVLWNTNKTFAKNLAERIASKYVLQPGDTIYMVRTNDTLESIAKHFHISTQILQAANQLNSTKLQSGIQLVIPTHYGEQSGIAENNSDQLEPGDTIYMVRRGDTVDKIAEKFHTTASSIRLANLIDDNSLIEGEKLVVPTHISS